MEIREHFNYGGWKNCVFISNGIIELVAATDVGPRIIKFGAAAGKNLFKENKDMIGKTGGDKWKYYGGHRLWHAPEEMTRSYFPDNSSVPYQINKNTLVLSQDTESSTGIKKEIEITMSDKENFVKVVHRIINKNLWDIELAPWALTIMTEGTKVIIPQEPFGLHDENLLPVRPIVLWSYTKMDDERFKWGSRYIQIRQDCSSASGQKIGTLNTAGWMAGYLDGEIFIKRYSYSPLAIYPDMGCNSEIYTDNAMIELETLNSLEIISPEGFAQHTEYWFYFKDFIKDTEDSIDEIMIPLIDKTSKFCKF